MTTLDVAEPTGRLRPTVGGGLGLAVGLSTSPCVFVLYYNYSYFNGYFSYLSRLGLSLTALGLANLAASGILGLAATGLARGPRLGPTAVGLLAGVTPGAYLGLQAAALVPPNAAATLVVVGVLFGSAIGAAVGHAVGTTATTASRAGRRGTWLGSAGLGVALGTSTGFYFTSFFVTPRLADAELIYPLAGGVTGLAVGLAAWWGRHNSPWLGRAGLGLAAGCCIGVWAYHDIGVIDGLFRQWGVWTVWLALGGAAGLAWVGRSGVARLRPAAAGLAVGAYTGAYCGILAHSSTASFQDSFVVGGLVGSLAGGALGVAVGTFGYHTRLGPAALGLTLGAFLGHSAFNDGLFYNYQGSLTPGFVGPVCVGVLGLVVGWLAGDARRRPAAFGLAIGGCVGAWAGGQAAFHILHRGEVAWDAIGMMAGGIIGLVISLRAGRLRFGSVSLGVAVGAFVGARLGDPDGRSVIRWTLGMAIGGCLGLVVCSRGERTVRTPLPGLAVGVFIGAWVGTDVIFEFPTQAPPAATSLICMVTGGLIGSMYGSRPITAGWALSLAEAVRQLRPTLPHHVRLVRLTRLSRWLVSLAAALAASGPPRKRYAEEFDSTLCMITGRLASLRRLLCAVSILACALALRAEVEDDPDA